MFQNMCVRALFVVLPMGRLTKDDVRTIFVTPDGNKKRDNNTLLVFLGRTGIQFRGANVATQLLDRTSMNKMRLRTHLP
jgi:hypothetical protein